MVPWRRLLCLYLARTWAWLRELPSCRTRRRLLPDESKNGSVFWSTLYTENTFSTSSFPVRSPKICLMEWSPYKRSSAESAASGFRAEKAAAAIGEGVSDDQSGSQGQHGGDDGDRLTAMVIPIACARAGCAGCAGDASYASDAGDVMRVVVLLLDLLVLLVLLLLMLALLVLLVHYVHQR